MDVSSSSTRCFWISARSFSFCKATICASLSISFWRSMFVDDATVSFNASTSFSSEFLATSNASFSMVRLLSVFACSFLASSIWSWRFPTWTSEDFARVSASLKFSLASITWRSNSRSAFSNSSIFTRNALASSWRRFSFSWLCASKFSILDRRSINSDSVALTLSFAAFAFVSATLCSSCAADNSASNVDLALSESAFDCSLNSSISIKRCSKFCTVVFLPLIWDSSSSFFERKLLSSASDSRSFSSAEATFDVLLSKSNWADSSCLRKSPDDDSYAVIFACA